MPHGLADLPAHDPTPAVTISLVEQARGGPFVFWGELEAACLYRCKGKSALTAVEIFAPSADVA